MQALFLALLGIFFNRMSGNCIALALHQQSLPDSHEDNWPQWLLLLHNGHKLGLILAQSCC